MRPTTLSLALAGLSVLTSIRSAAAQSEYRITDLGTLPGCVQSWAYGINASGEVVGDCYDYGANERHAFVWDGAAMMDLGALPGGRFAWAYGINDSGQIAGISETSDGFQSYYYGYLRDGAMSALTVPSGSQTSANAIDSAGVVVGGAGIDPNEPLRAVVWTDPMSATSLGALILHGASEAFGIEDGGWVVGSATTFDGFAYWSHAFLWDGAAMTDLGTFGGPTGYSKAFDVNAAHQVVGYSEDRTMGFEHAFLWESGVMTDLGTLGPNLQISRAYAINDVGQIVGAGNTSSSNWHAVLWEGGSVRDLNDLVIPTNHGWELVSAEDINDAGQIVGYGYPPSVPHLHAFRLDPIEAIDAYCFGDASSCPCGNAGAPDAGCDNAQGTGGVKLEVASFAPDFAGGGAATLTGTGFPLASTPTAIVIRSPSQESPPVVFGDGLRCIGLLGLVRFGATIASGGASVHVTSHGAGAGSFHYQIHYRSTPQAFCDPAAAFNLSNGLTLTWP